MIQLFGQIEDIQGCAGVGTQFTIHITNIEKQTADVRRRVGQPGGSDFGKCMQKLYTHKQTHIGKDPDAGKD